MKNNSGFVIVYFICSLFTKI